MSERKRAASKASRDASVRFSAEARTMFFVFPNVHWMAVAVVVIKIVVVVCLLACCCMLCVVCCLLIVLPCSHPSSADQHRPIFVYSCLFLSLPTRKCRMLCMSSVFCLICVATYCLSCTQQHGWHKQLLQDSDSPW